MGIWFTSVAWRPNDKSSQRLLLSEESLDIVLPQAGEKRSHPSADIQVINGVPNADYCHLKAVGFALLGSIFWHESALCQPKSGFLKVRNVTSLKNTGAAPSVHLRIKT